MSIRAAFRGRNDPVLSSLTRRATDIVLRAFGNFADCTANHVLHVDQLNKLDSNH